MNHYNILNIKNKVSKFSRFLRKVIILLVIIIIALVSVVNSRVVREDEIVIIRNFDKIIKIIDKPGLYFKIPFINAISIITKKNMHYNSQLSKVITKDRMNLLIDYYAVWRINNPIDFLKTVENTNGAEIKIDDTVFSALAAIFGSLDYNNIFDNSYNEKIIVIANQKVEMFGINIIDVRVRNIKLPQENEDYVFARMKSDIEKISAQNLSAGEKQAVEIKAETDKQVKIIISKAHAEAEKIKGDADAKAAKIYSKSYNRDPEFYSFMRTIESYKKTLINKPTIIIPASSPYVKYLFNK